jgi:signal transduction histidine kinase
VLDTLVQSAVTLSGAPTGTIFQKRGELYHLTAQCGYTPEMLAYGSAHPIAPSMGSNVGRTAITGAVVQIPDVLADPDFTAHGYQRVGNYRAMLGIPLKRDGKVEGVFSLAKPEPGPFEPRHVELVQIFADQAVIAIENVRLFEEVQAKTRDLEESLQQQTATADVLKVISRSAFDLDTVMNTLARSARELCGSKTAVLFLRDGEFLFCRGAAAVKRVDEEFMRENPVELNNDSHIGRAVLTGTIANVGDILNSHTKLRKFQQAMGFRSFLAVPLMREGRGIGVFALSRDELGTFSQRQVDLVQGFADQAVIAIENVRLFDEVQARTRELVKSLDDLRTAQDRLIQTEKLASLGQLTAGIAHEIKNPLNFVNNFSTLSAELTDELNDLLKRERLTDKGRQEADELTRLLQDNLSKVVQHGKRADSIVKNMLLHSREGSGERRLVDVNALVTESLNLAYHGARAEKAGFSITLKHDLDPEAGALDLYPQEMTRALLNMISNGFYAATKRKLEVGDGTFEPILSVATTNFDKTVEIRIRDNGTGIPLEVRENIFNPFFTTKPTGEGTGLGLSMTHDIIVKQHGGRIDVETKLGEFTEFIITLPRDNGAVVAEKSE